MTNEVDTHSPADAVAWLRKRAEENRRVAELPPQDWPRDPGVLKHLAFRFDQTADLIDRLDKKCAALAYLLYGNPNAEPPSTPPVPEMRDPYRPKNTGDV